MKPTQKLRSISAGTLAVLLLASCSGDLQPGADAGSPSALLQLHSLRASGVSGAATRAGTTHDYPTDRFIGFFVKADAPNGYAACDNYKGAYDVTGAKWLPAPDILLNNHNADIAVYAPYDIAQTTPGALNLAACLRPADGSKDIWCKRFTANNQNTGLSLTLEHIYTRLTLSVSRSTDYKEEATLADISLTGNEIYAGAAYRFFEAASYDFDGAVRGFSASSTQVLNDASPTASYDLLLIPTAVLTGDLTLAFTVNGRKMRVTVAREKFADTGGKLEAGRQYNIGLKLVPGKLAIVSVAIVKWDTLAEVEGGDAGYEPDIPIGPDGSIDAGGYEPDPEIGGDITNDTPEEI